MNSANTKAYSLSFLLQRSFDYPTGCNFLMGCKVNKEGCSCNSHVIYIISTGNSTLDQSSPLPCTHTVDIIQMLLGCFESKRWGGKITIFHLFLNFYGIQIHAIMLNTFSYYDADLISFMFQDCLSPCHCDAGPQKCILQTIQEYMSTCICKHASIHVKAKQLK